MNTRERFHAIADYKEFDRLPILEWAGWWDKTKERWHGEGLPRNLKDRYEISEYFDLDIYYQYWFRGASPDAPQPKSHGAGIVSNEKEYESTKPFLYQIGDNLDNTLREVEKRTKIQEKGDAAIWFSLDGFFWFPRVLLGIEEHLYAFYDSPELMHRINSDNTEWMLKVIDRLCDVCEPDFMTFAEDMSYNNGPMISKELFYEFMKPYYDIVVPHLKKRGIRVFVDSDGDISEPAAWFEDAGLEGILPLEAQAGVDLPKLREAHPQMLLMGAFDKMTMPKGEKAMRAEFERLLPVAAKGGFFISCDHQTPPGVSLENYKIYLKLFREFAKLAGDASG